VPGGLRTQEPRREPGEGCLLTSLIVLSWRSPIAPGPGRLPVAGGACSGHWRAARPRALVLEPDPVGAILAAVGSVEDRLRNAVGDAFLPEPLESWVVGDHLIVEPVGFLGGRHSGWTIRPVVDSIPASCAGADRRGGPFPVSRRESRGHHCGQPPTARRSRALHLRFSAGTGSAGAPALTGRTNTRLCQTGVGRHPS